MHYVPALVQGEHLTGEEYQALMADATVLLMDEPSLGLAPKVISEVFAALRVLKDQGHALLLVEQRVDAALAISDRRYVMQRGAIVLDGPSGDLAKSRQLIAAYLGEESRMDNAEAERSGPETDFV